MRLLFPIEDLRRTAMLGSALLPLVLGLGLAAAFPRSLRLFQHGLYRGDAGNYQLSMDTSIGVSTISSDFPIVIVDENGTESASLLESEYYEGDLTEEEIQEIIDLALGPSHSKALNQLVADNLQKDWDEEVKPSRNITITLFIRFSTSSKE
jgi:PHD/YefM family antitoxin component YafN of YafNO toxin-antitoxin module